MRHHQQGSRHAGRALCLALLWIMFMVRPVAAECVGPEDPWPSFRSAAPSAEQVIVGVVMAPATSSGSTGALAAFRLRITNVLRGPASPGDVLDIIGMKSGLPLTVCADTVLTLVPDDVVALALNAKADDGATTINTVAFLRKAGESDLVGVEELTFGDLMALVSPAEPPTEQPAEPLTERPAEPPTERAFPAALLLALLVVLVVMGAIAANRRATRKAAK
jgi:hypothetical protein